MVGGTLRDFSIFSSPGRSDGVGVSKILKFLRLMGTALSGKLSCPCDRSC